MKTHKSNKKEPQKELTPEEQAAAHEKAMGEARTNAAMVGRLTIESAGELAPERANYYRRMYEELQNVGFTKDEAMEITKNIKI